MKRIQYQTCREISTIEVDKELDLVAYQERIFVNDTILEQKEGIARQADIDAVELSVPIQRSEYMLFDNNVLEAQRTMPRSHEFYDLYKQYQILTPYSYLLGASDFSVLLQPKLSWDGNLYDTQGNAVPRALLFDVTSGSVHSDRYDIIEAQQILSARQDIRFLKEDIVNGWFDLGERCTDYLIFVWTPSLPDWEKVRVLSNSVEQYNYVQKHIFKLPEKSDYKGY